MFAYTTVNADYVQNRPAILIVDQQVSPFFSHGSGPTGFEASFKHDVRNGLGIKVDVSGYSDTFPPGPAAYCQSDSSTAGIACGTGLTFQATGRALYVTVGPEWKIRRGKRFAPFAEALLGIVSTRSTFMMSGSDVQTQIPLQEGCCCSPVQGSPRIEASIPLTPMPMPDWRWRLAAALTSDLANGSAFAARVSMIR